MRYMALGGLMDWTNCWLDTAKMFQDTYGFSKPSDCAVMLDLDKLVASMATYPPAAPAQYKYQGVQQTPEQVIAQQAADTRAKQRAEAARQAAEYAATWPEGLIPPAPIPTDDTLLWVALAVGAAALVIAFVR